MVYAPVLVEAGVPDIADSPPSRLGAKVSQLRAADWSGMTFTVQKSGVSGEIVGQARSGALHACLVVDLAEL